MLLFPSIHIKDGAVARLTRGEGDFAEAEVLHSDPVARAAGFERQGFPWLHIVDLDGAFAGCPVNVAAVERIMQAVKIPVQLSGGIRDLEIVEGWLDKGVARVVLNTMALEEPVLAREGCRKFPGRVAVKIDSRGGLVARTGWLRTSRVKALDLALRFEDSGAAAIIYADINRDGALGEVNREAILDLAFALTTPVIASGGIHSLADIAALKSETRAGVAGLILGGALHRGEIDAGEALKLVASC
ncbi:MAG TPA: 1-(5-phosphoribosyl)-5-[(5-phosphoribosylamino)methylideneamino] imidazole-4-carboxamide isomerase [Alphaproteobacteria bacterium]|nr:1-(5-phosphoribosyl)-5-[(5-phosphoribosylamino)methylideneamino] imidazole-4-carboxamide isomerase [Alphaproteobacteria bacterium]